MQRLDISVEPKLLIQYFPTKHLQLQAKDIQYIGITLAHGACKNWVVHGKGMIIGTNRGSYKSSDHTQDRLEQYKLS